MNVTRNAFYAWLERSQTALEKDNAKLIYLNRLYLWTYAVGQISRTHAPNLLGARCLIGLRFLPDVSNISDGKAFI